MHLRLPPSKSLYLSKHIYCSDMYDHNTPASRQIIFLHYPVAETWRRVWGADKNFGGPRFLNDVFWEKFTFSRQNFLVIDQIFQIFSFFSPTFPISPMLNVTFD